MKKKIISAACAMLMAVSFVGCGSSDDESKVTVKVYDEGEIGESGKYVMSSWHDLSFDKNEDGVITAAEINSSVPDFALYPFGNGFMGFASAKEKEEKIYAVKVPVSIDGSDYTLNMTFNKDQELLEWYIMFFQMWTSSDSTSKMAGDYRASIEKFDESFGSRIKSVEQVGSDKIVTSWKDGGYTQVNYTKN